MYTVKCITDGVEALLYHPLDKELQLIAPVLNLGIGKTGGFSFSFPPNNINRDKLEPLSSEISVYDDGELLFCGRRIDSNSDFHSICQVECEGELAYLLDSQQRPFTFTGNIKAFIQSLLEVHNNQVESKKRFEVGNITVTGAGADAQRTLDECMSTFDVMQSYLAEEYGGYFRIRHQGEKRYLDYVWDYGGENEQIIRFGENLLDLSDYIDPTEICTAVIPYGATVDDNDTDRTYRVDIKSVNGNVDYIYNQEAVDRFGWIYKSITFDDVEDPTILKQKAQAYLDDCIGLPETLEIRAVDLARAGQDISKMKVGYWTRLITKPHGFDRRLLLSQVTLNLLAPDQDMFVLGQTIQTFTSNSVKAQIEISARVDRVASEASKEIRQKVENATQLITGGKGGYVVLDVDDPDTGKRALPWRILVMNTPDKDTATNVIQINQNGIGFSTTGINGPYANAWTIDGNLVADFVTAGTMLADRIRGGILEVGGSGLARDGKIVIKDASDRQIGYWDKTGLHVMLGVIEGSIINGGTINGSNIISGTINIGGGTFEVDSDGAVVINTGTINIGNVLITQNFTWLGDFGISSTGDGLLYSRDNENSVQIASSAWSFFPASITLQHSGKKSTVSCGGINTGDIFLDRLRAEYGAAWESVSDNIIELWNRIARIENKS